jgi:SanA protein
MSGRLAMVVRLVALLGTFGAAGLAAAAATNWWVDRLGGTFYSRARDVPARPVAIVLGARVFANGHPSAVLEDRLATAFELYEGGKVDRILVSGDHATDAYDEVNAMHAWLVARGVPDDRIFLDHAGLRTFDTMQRAARVFEVESAIVCTQRFHLPRALFLARRAGIDAVGIVADRRAYRRSRLYRAREWIARPIAFADSYLLATRSRHLGDPIPITGNGRATHDRRTGGGAQ